MISLRKFRILIGSMILFSHFLAIAIMVGFSVYYFLPVKALVGNVVAVTPIAGLYALTYYRYITFNPNELLSEVGKRIGGASLITQSSVVGLFCICLVLVPIYCFLFGVIDDARIFVGGIETIFGGFIAITFGLLFPSELLGDADRQ